MWESLPQLLQNTRVTIFLGATKQRRGVRKMFKKISSIILLSGLILVSGGFQTTADASAGAEQQYSKQGNGSWQYVSINKWQVDVSKYINKWYNEQLNANYKKYNHQPKKSHKQQKQAENKAQPKEKVEQAKEEVEKVEEVDKIEKVDKAPVEQTEQVEQDTTNDTVQNNTELDQLNAYEQEVVNLTNEERVKQGLAPFQVDLELSKVAREKSRDMSASNYFDHNSPTYGSPFDMMKAYGITYRTAGENIAKGQRTPSEVVNGWMNSPGHRANILNSNFTHIGVGFVEQGNHWTQQFIGK